MFGYVKPLKNELLVKDDAFYRATYCGICHAMRGLTGEGSRLFLTYDSVFLALCRMVFLPDEAFSAQPMRCLAHPCKAQTVLLPNEATSYAARVSLCLSYRKNLDDRKDKDGGAWATPLLRAAARRADLPALDAMIAEKLERIAALEDEEVAAPDAGATLFGELLGEVFAYGMTEDAAVLLRATGYHLGRFIYAADAAEDYEADRKRGRYNPYVLTYGTETMSPGNRETVKTALLLEIGEIEKAVDLFPFGARKTLERLVRNVVFLGLVDRIVFLDTETKGMPTE